MSILVLQSSWWGRESWLLCLICLPGVTWWFSGSSSRCHRVVCCLWLWYFLIILTYYFCRMLQGEHSAMLSTFIQLSFVIKIFVLSIFEWLFYTGFTVYFTCWLTRLFAGKSEQICTRWNKIRTISRMLQMYVRHHLKMCLFIWYRRAASWVSKLNMYIH